MSKSFRYVILLGFLVTIMCCCLSVGIFKSQVANVEAQTEAIVAWGYQSSAVNLLIPSAVTFDTRAEAMRYLLEYKNESFAFQCHNDEEASLISYSQLVEIECDQGLVAVFKDN